MAGFGLGVLALLVTGASAVSFADQAGKGSVDRQLLGAHSWGKPNQSVRGDIYEKLKAVPGGPYKVKRGGKVELDGSGSRPKKKITSYTWTFESECPESAEGVPGVQAPAVSLSGKQVKIVAVCDTKATLTVSDGQTSASKDTEIKVTGKLPEVKYTQGDDADARNLPFDTKGGVFAFGLNRCKIEWDKSEDPNLDDHWLHRRRDGTDVDTTQVSDPGGPYDGFYYVTDHHLKVTRQMVINSKLLPKGKVYKLNQDTRAHREAIDNIAEAVIDHERIHGNLVKERLESKKLKFLDKLADAVDLSDEALQTRADFIIGNGETELKEASSESRVQRRMKRIWKDKKAEILRPSDNKPFPYVIAEIGDDGAGSGVTPTPTP
jgi:hypothetical protein